MNTKQKGTLPLVVGVILFPVTTMILVAWLSPVSNTIITDSATTLAVITATVIGIERLLEIMWTIIGVTKGSSWPFSEIHSQIESIVSNLNKTLEPSYENAEKAIDRLAQANTWSQEQVAEAKKEWERLKGMIGYINTISFDNKRVDDAIIEFRKSLNDLEKKYDDETLRKVALAADRAVVIAAESLETFKGNPGRRLISICVGTILGLFVAGVFGLDLFQAVLETNRTDAWQWGVALTGLFLGLGSDPTHQVIRTLEEIKSNQGRQ